MKRALACLAGLMVAAFGCPSRAQSASAGESTAELEGLLETSVVSAPSKTPETVSLAPSSSLVLSAEDLKRYGIRSLDEAINFLSFGMVVERLFQIGEVGARGVLLTSDYGSHVLLMVDGQVLNEQWGGAAYFDRGATIPFELIDHIEIVLGPGSVLYGSNAMLGIVHIVTKRAKDFSGAHLVLESELPISLRGAAGYGKEFRLFGSDAELVLELEHYEQRGPVFDFGPQQAAPDSVSGVVRDFDVTPADRKYPAGVWGGRGDDAYYTQAPSAYLRLRVGDFELGARAALFKRTYPSNGGNFDDPDSYELDRWLHLDLKHSVSLGAATRLSTRLYSDAYGYDEYWTSNGAQDCLDGQVSGCQFVLRGSTQSVGLEPQLSVDWFEDGRAVALLGLDGRIKGIRSSVVFNDNLTGISPAGTGAYDFTEKALAGYVQQTFWPTGWVALNAGARVDVDDRFGDHLSPRAALSVLPWPGGTWKAMYSEAFRAPTAYDIYFTDRSAQLAGGKGLAPEIVRSVEGTVEQRFGTQTLQLGIFRSWWEDLLLLQGVEPSELEAGIERGELSPTTESALQVRNVSSIASYGFNLGFEGALSAGRLRYGLSVTEAVARRVEPDGSENLLAVAPSAFGNARLSYDLSNGFPTLALAGRWVARRPTSDYPASGFAKPLWEARFTASGPLPAFAAISYRFSVNYVGAERGAYVLRDGTLPNGERELTRQDRLRFAIGLQYDFSL